jgi:hypothetical protein
MVSTRRDRVGLWLRGSGYDVGFQQARELFGLVGWITVGEQVSDRFAHLGNRLARLIGQDERLILNLGDGLFLQHRQNRGRRVLPQLRIDWPQDRVRAHDDLVRRQGN